MDPSLEDGALNLFEGMMARTHFCRPDDVAEVVVSEAHRALGASGGVLYWVNKERTTLNPLQAESSPARAEQQVDGSVAGRAYATSQILSVPAESGRRRAFVPVLDGTDRIGVLELELPVPAEDEVPEDLVVVLERYGHAVAQALVAKKAYGDSLELVQRSRPMDLGAELVWSVVPPLTFATDGLVISAMLEPAYENGGDAFDYAVNEDVTHIAIVDGMGHGLTAAGLSTFAVAAYRHSRRAGLGLLETYASMDAAVAAHFGENSFVTAVLAQLDTDTGVLRWVNAGHPPPLVLRDGRVVKVLESDPATPLGLPMFSSRATVEKEQLEPGDVVVLYTDGVTEARRPDGQFLGVEGLTEFLQRESSAGQAPPETLRRLQRIILSADGARLNDDATVLLVDWQRGTEQKLLPQTV